MDFSLPGFSVHGIFQAGVLEWGAIAFSTFKTGKKRVLSGDREELRDCSEFRREFKNYLDSQQRE